MDLFTLLPEWLVWSAAGAAGFVALGTVAGMLESALDLEVR